MTELLFRDDPYAQQCDAVVTAIDDGGGIILDRTIFYAAGGGQPGDSGVLSAEGLEACPIAATVHGENGEIVHIPAGGVAALRPGTPVQLALNWETRYRHMRMHTALHLLCALLPHPVTGGQIGADSGRLDFDIPDASMADKQELTERLAELIAARHPVGERWISDEELLAKPDLVRTMAVKPPMGAGRVRLIAIGTNGEVDLQPCGGTHVRDTGEIGAVTVAKIEKKGRQNRRVRLVFND